MGYILNKEFKMEFTIKKIKYRNDDCFTIADCKINKILNYNGDKPTNLPIRGVFPTCYEGDSYEGVCLIEENYHDGYLLRLKEGLKTIQPATKKELAKFIHKKTSGVGIDLISRAIDELGLKLIDIIINNPDKLRTVKGMTNDKIKKLYEGLKPLHVYEEIILFIQSLGMSASLASKIFDEFGNESLGIIMKKPYRICSIKDITFDKADKIALSFGWNFDHPLRVKSGILAFLENEATRRGSLCVNREEIVEGLNNFLWTKGVYGKTEEIPIDKINEYLEEMKQYKKIITYRSKNRITYVYKKYFYDIETALIKNIKKFKKEEPDVMFVPDLVINEVIANESLDIKQIEAIRQALQNRLSIVTGGPGTGKTHTINMIVKCQEKFNPESTIVMAAPTGKASRRMSELTKRDASTLHRLLGIFDSDGKNKKKIKADLLIIDESSMVDAVLAKTLFESINKECKVVLVGDVNQIEAVGVGAFFKDVINSKSVPTVVLDKVFRQGEGSVIISNSKSLLEERIDDIQFDAKDFTLTTRKTVEGVQNVIVEMMKRKLFNYKASLDDIYVLTPTNETLLGTKELNRAIQQAVNKDAYGIELNDHLEFKLGDKVINTRNNTDLDVDNGDIGVVVDIDSDIPSVTVKLFQREGEVVFKDEALSDLELAYAMTIHKSQGSETNTVIMPLVPSQSFMLNKNLIYTAWTRARKNIHMIGDKEVINMSIQSQENQLINRVSCLSERL